MALGMPTGWREARLDWMSLPRDVRSDVTARARAGEPHPDPAVRRIARCYAASFVDVPPRAAAVWLGGFFAAGAAGIVLGSLLLGVDASSIAWIGFALVGPLSLIWQWKEAQRIGRANGYDRTAL